MKSTFDLKDKVIVVTGGSGLLGKAFSKSIIAAGGIAIVAGIDKVEGRNVCDELNEGCDCEAAFFHKVDITSVKDIQKMIEAVTKKHGKIDGLVNNAYPRNKKYGQKFEDVTYDDFCENVGMHLGGYFLISKEIAQVMKAGGTIVNMASIYGFHAPRFDIYEGTDMTMPVEYAAIKGGLLNLNKYMAVYLGEKGIRVNAISPGGVFNDQSNSFVEKYEAQVPLGNRMATVADLQGALLYLLSDASSYVTGQNMVVDGGWSQ